MSTRPRVSIVLPTYNRRDTLPRAIESVRRQSFEDWELVVVDDGSTDGTRDLLDGADAGIRLIVQENQGVAGARNTGLAAASGSLVAFLDSDDEWPRHHLALATAFFDAHPGEHVYTSEFWEDFGDRQYVKHFRVETGDWYPRTARQIGSKAFDRSPPEGDPYLWFYETRSEVGPWARPILDGAVTEPVFHYRGDIFQKWRWGWLMALQPTVITRHAMETVGPNDTSYTVASDFGYMAALCRAFTVNFVSAPGCIKHELSSARDRLAEGHLVTGPTATRFHRDVLRFHEELFWKARPTDPELAALRGFRQMLAGEAALKQGDREVALEYLEQAVLSYPPLRGSAMLRIAKAIPGERLASLAYRGWLAGAQVTRRLRAFAPSARVL